MVIFYRFWPIFWPQWDPIDLKMDPRGSPPWFGAITINSIFCPNRWPRSSEKFEFWGMVVIYGFDPFFLTQWDPIGPKMDPRGSPPWIGAITVNSIFCPNRCPNRGVVKIRILGHGNFLRFWPIFWPQWDPIGPKMDPRGSPPWFGAITINSIFCPIRWPRSSKKFEFLGHGSYLRFWPIFFNPMGPHWPQDGP